MSGVRRIVRPEPEPVSTKEPMTKEEAVHELREHLPLAIETLLDVMQGSSNRDRMKAAVALMDRCGLTPGAQLEISGPDGEPMTFKHLTYEELLGLVNGVTQPKQS